MVKITQQGSFGAYHFHLQQALQDAVKEYVGLHAKTEEKPLTEETASPSVMKLHQRCEQARIRVILLAASCVEALANLYIALRTTPEQFAILERATLIEKWTAAPSFFAEGYSFPKDGELYQDLKRVAERRNALVHLKAEVTKGEAVIHEGKPVPSAGDEPAFVARCATLPKRLFKHVVSIDAGDDLMSVAMTLSFAWPSDEALERAEQAIEKEIRSQTAAALPDKTTR